MSQGLTTVADQTIDLLFRMLRQNGGQLSQRARQSEFAQLNPDEAHKAEQIYAKAFETANP